VESKTRRKISLSLAMKQNRIVFLIGAIITLTTVPICGAAQQQRARAIATEQSDAEFGPVVRAYLGYLRGEQEVVDDRASRREISAAYYRRNSNRIRALRQIALRIARESQNDYLPEFEAVTREEFGSLFEKPPRPLTLRVGGVLNNTFRFLSTVRAGEVFYVFARLDPYEQAELMQKSSPPSVSPAPPASAIRAATPAKSNVPLTPPGEPAASRPRRTSAP